MAKNVPVIMEDGTLGIIPVEIGGGTGGTSYTSSDSIEFTGGASPTANVRISDSANSPLSIEGGTAQGLKFNCGSGLKVDYGELMLDDTYIEISTGKLHLHNFEIQNEDLKLSGTAKLFFDGEGQERFGGGDIQRRLTVGENVKLANNTISSPAFGTIDTTSIASGTVAVAPWTRYTGTCDLLALTSVPTGDQESEIVVTFAGTAANPDVGLPIGTQYVGTLPTYVAGHTYLMNIRSGIVRAEEVLRVLPPQLSYLESTGTQYIDTGIVPTNATKIEMTLAEAYASFGSTPFGSFDTTSGAVKNYGVFTSAAGGWVFPFGSHWLDVSLGSATDVTKIRIENGKAYFNDVLKGTADGTFTCTDSLFLYAARRVNSGGVPQFLSSCKISSCKIWLDGSKLSRDYVPLLWTAGYPYIDGNTGLTVTPTTDKPGWYDKVSGRLFVNKGTSEFLY